MKFLVIGGIDLSQNKETEIQLQYIEKCKELLAKSSTKRPTFHIQNEGCQMNSIQTESIAAIMEKWDMKWSIPRMPMQLYLTPAQSVKMPIRRSMDILDI